ncbi:MAG: MtrB/PioB family outer membrane beta-barrel protein [Terriglobia bacterium]|jgi:hypothetical protein
MRLGKQLLIPLAGLLLSGSVLVAQDGAETPLTLGGFNTQGSVTVGYRFDDVKGYVPMFQELSDLNKGFRLMDFNMFGEAVKGANPFADSYSLSVSGLGGEPFEMGQLSVKKNRLYDFRANWRQSYFYSNQNDNVVLPIAAVGAGLSTGLTDNHDWGTVRKFGSADLTLHATNNLRFNFDYYRTTDSGPTFTTESLDFFDSPSYWGTFARANPYSLYAPINDDTNRFTGGIDYTYRAWTFHYNLGYQTFSENVSLNNVGSPELSINPVASSTKEPLTSLSQSEYRRLTTPISEFSFTGKPLPKFEWRGGYIYYRYQGPATFDQSFNGTAPNSSGAYAPYTVSQTARAMVTEPDNILYQTLTFKPKDWWEIIADYHYSRFSTNSVGNFGSIQSIVTNPTSATPVTLTTPSSGTDSEVWRDGVSDFEFSMLFTPTPSLTLRPGVRLLKADVEAFSNGVIDPEITLRTKTAWPELSFGYQPSKMFSVRGDVHSFDNGSSFTAITPHTEVAGHLITRFQPFKKVSLQDDLNLTNDKLIDSSFQDNVHSNTVTLTYTLNDRFSVFTGYTYDSIFAAGNIVYARGTAPLNDFLRDQEADRVMQAGVEAKPSKYFGLQLTGNFDRSTGLGQISGEPPAYGPLTWPLVTGTVYVNFPKAGRLSLDLQRTYYIEQIITANNFQANLLTIRWTRDF